MQATKEKKHHFDFNKSIRDHAQSSALIVAAELGIFEALKDNFLSIQEIKEKCSIKIPNRNLNYFLDILHINNLLLCEGKLEFSKYKTSNNLFIKSNKNNLLPLIQMLKQIKKRYEMLPELMRLGRYAENKITLKEIYSDLNNENNKNNFNNDNNNNNNNNNDVKSFLRVMSNLHFDFFKAFAKSFDCKSFKSCLDIGGCLGAFSIEMKKSNPHLIVKTFDLQVIEKFVYEFLNEHGKLDDVNVISGDFFVDEFPKSDIIMMANILHNWSLEKKQLLVKKAFNALSDNGVFFVVEKFVDSERIEDGNALYSSFDLFVECLDGYNLSKEELQEIGKYAGFKSFKFFKVEENDVEYVLFRK